MKSLEDLIDAHLRGERIQVPESHREEFAQAIAAHEAIRDALGETILLDGRPISAAESPDESDRRPPELPADYEIIRELGRGGMGVVYLARQNSLDRLVAVKVLRVGEATGGPAIRRFQEEARHLARLRHPHIVAVHEVGRDARGEPYFTMDYVDGESLTALLAREGRLQPSRAVGLIRQAAEAVRHAHGQGLIHRDLKPGNILLDPLGQAYVTDFGLARDLAGSAGLTRTGELMGTPAYMAPEQVLGQADRIGEATDVHALGAILYEMLTGRAPYGQDAPARVMARILDAEPKAPRRIDRRIPRDLETICLIALAKSPAQRYATAAAFLEDVRRFEKGQTPLARRPGPLVRAARFTLRHWRTPTIAAALAAVILGLWALVLPALVPSELPAVRGEPDAGAAIASLIAEGEQYDVAGQPALAVRFYGAALRRAEGEERRVLQDRIRDCLPRIEDPAAALEVALPLVELAPDLSFGRYDYLIARTLALQTQHIGTGITLDHETNRYVPDISPQERPRLELAERRLAAFLDSKRGSEAERAEFERLLSGLRERLSGAPRGPVVSWTPWEDILPGKSIDELAREFADPEGHPLDRGKVGLVLGGKREEAGDPEAALATYRAAYDLARPVFPFYLRFEGAARPGSPAWFDRQRLDPEGDLSLLPRLIDAILRLDPSVPDPLRGSVNLKFEGVEIPKGVEITFRLNLVDADLDPEAVRELSHAGRGMAYSIAHQLSRPLMFRADQPAVSVGVAEGRYRIALSSSYSYMIDGDDDGPQRFMSLLDVDVPHEDARGYWPEPVFVADGPVELPSLRARLLQEIVLENPGSDAPVDLRQEIFRWSALDGAHRYDLGFIIDRDGVSTGMPGPRGLDQTSFCFGVPHVSNTNESLAKLKGELRPGTLAEWSIHAYDNDGVLIGKSRESRRFVVARGVDDGVRAAQDRGE